MQISEEGSCLHQLSSFTWQVKVYYRPACTSDRWSHMWQPYNKLPEFWNKPFCTWQQETSWGCISEQQVSFLFLCVCPWWYFELLSNILRPAERKSSKERTLHHAEICAKLEQSRKSTWTNWTKPTHVSIFKLVFKSFSKYLLIFMSDYWKWMFKKPNLTRNSKCPPERS